MKIQEYKPSEEVVSFIKENISKNIHKMPHDEKIKDEEIIDKEIEKILKNFNENNTLLLTEENVLKAITNFEYKEWESKILNKKIANLNIITKNNIDISKLLKKIEKKIKKDKIKLISIRIDANNQEIIEILIKNKYILIENYLTFSHDLTGKRIKNKNIRQFKEQEIEEIGKLAEVSFTYDRFHKDSKIDKELANKTRKEWIINSCKGRAEQVLVYSDKKILGFVAINLNKDYNYASLDLIAVSSDSQGKGIGKALTNEFLDYSKKITNLGIVGTQSTNIASVRMYESCGFKLFNSQLTFHKHL